MQRELTRLAGSPGWPASATLKDLRHLFATTLNNAGVSEGYRRYLTEHVPDKVAVGADTHLGQLRRPDSSAVLRAWAHWVVAVSGHDAALSRGPGPRS